MHEIVPPHLAVRAMRDNGYKNAAYAIAELMDNSIQAGASRVELLCGEKELMLEQRRRFRIEKVAVLDNGCGMDSDVLRLALQFGNGTHLDEETPKGIGRFGMGLPASSISQCRRVEVWSWQNGADSALYSYLDIDKIAHREMREVPEPIRKAIPAVWRNVSKGIDGSGTLVVWSDIDRCVWKTAGTIIDNSEFLIGRMYRKFLENETVQIRLAGFDWNSPGTVRTHKYATPNDPGYLMEKTSCPSPYDVKPMFQKWGDEDFEIAVEIDFQGRTHLTRLRFSYAKEEARKTPNAGATPYGKHAGRNVGVSLVRAGRELELDQSWVIQYDPRERWWGVEVDFPPSLDELFGVTNNKQSARNFSELGSFDMEALLKGGRTMAEAKAELEQEEDPRAPLLEIAHRINSSLGVVRRLIEAQSKGQRSSRRRHDATGRPTAEDEATAVTRKRQEEGHRGASDEDEKLPGDERRGIIEQSLIDEGVPRQVATDLAATTVSDGLKYVFAEADLETPAFFSVKQRGGSIVITLNTSHPAYPRFVDVLERDYDGSGEEELQERLGKALDGLKLVLMAWSRYEDEQPDGVLRSRAQEARVDWGRIARQFLQTED